jgi:hypothetical protein
MKVKKSGRPILFVQQSDYGDNIQYVYRFSINGENSQVMGNSILEKDKNIREENGIVGELDQASDISIFPISIQEKNEVIKNKLQSEESEENEKKFNKSPFVSEKQSEILERNAPENFLNENVYERTENKTNRNNTGDKSYSADSNSDEVYTIDAENQKESENIQKLINRLAIYPYVLERPFCEAMINGKKEIIQIMGKRGKKIRIKRNRKIENVHIHDIEYLNVLL